MIRVAVNAEAPSLIDLTAQSVSSIEEETLAELKDHGMPLKAHRFDVAK
jgi:hypothetical protein